MNIWLGTGTQRKFRGKKGDIFRTSLTAILPNVKSYCDPCELCQGPYIAPVLFGLPRCSQMSREFCHVKAGKFGCDLWPATCLDAQNQNFSFFLAQYHIPGYFLVVSYLFDWGRAGHARPQARLYHWVKSQQNDGRFQGDFNGILVILGVISWDFMEDSKIHGIWTWEHSANDDPMSWWSNELVGSSHELARTRPNFP